MNKTIKVGLIGYGIGGQVFHAPVLSAVKGLQLSVIRASNPEHVALAKSRFPEARVVADSDTLFQDPTLELIVITVPNIYHLPLAKKALEAGKNVVVDKPFTITSQQADELIGVAESHNRMLSVFHSRRFDSDFRTVQQVIRSGTLGEIVEFESRYDRFRNYLKPQAWREEPQPGSGILYDLGAHLIDQALTLFGLPDSITADIRMQRPGAKVDDNFELILHYPALKVSLKAGMLVREPLERFIVLGMEGSFVKKGLDVQEEALKAGLRPGATPAWGVEPESIWGTLNTTFNGIHLKGLVESEKGNYVDYYQNIYEVLTGTAALAVTPQQARNVIRVIELAVQSHREAKTIEYS
ncbi:MAG: oxidoreductase [Bacteroidota bacterium]|nr:oxidoreductase [Bacteroidota bacterium]